MYSFTNKQRNFIIIALAVGLLITSTCLVLNRPSADKPVEKKLNFSEASLLACESAYKSKNGVATEKLWWDGAMFLVTAKVFPFVENFKDNPKNGPIPSCTYKVGLPPEA